MLDAHELPGEQGCFQMTPLKRDAAITSPPGQNGPKKQRRHPIPNSREMETGICAPQRNIRDKPLLLKELEGLGSAGDPLRQWGQ